MAKVTADWLDLKVREYDDGAIEGYEALTDTRCEGDWDKVMRWVQRLLEEADAERAADLEGA